jgi:WD40 repeat protein/tetratricopeptide (TPR) repeat protein
VWDAATGQLITSSLKHNSDVNSAVFSPDGRHVVTGSRDTTARVWDVATGQPVSLSLKHADRVNSVAFSPDGRRVLTGSRDGTVRVWDVATGQPVSLSLKHPMGVWHAVFSPDGRRVVTTSLRVYDARVWDAVTGQPITPPLEHTSGVNRAAFSADGRRVVTASWDNTARVWDATTGQPISPPLKHNSGVNTAVFSADGRRVLTAGGDGTARVWDAATGQLVIATLKHNGTVADAAFSRDGLRVVTAGGDGTARVWDAATGRPIARPLRHNSGVNSAEFSPDGRRVLTASEDSTARVWDAATGRPITLPLKHNGAVNRAAFSTDGRYVVTASGDFTVRVWDAATGRPITPPLKHDEDVEHAAFSPDGRRVVTGSHDQTARVWDLPTDSRPAAELRRLAQCLAGYRIDVLAGSVLLEPAVARREEQALRAKYPADFAATPGQVLAWHEQEAVDAEGAGAAAAALPHLDALLAANPVSGALHARRGRAHAELGHWEQAAADFARAAELEPDVSTHGSSQALAHLANGDTSGYQRSCAAMLARFGRSVHLADAHTVVRTCVALPDAVTDTAQLMALAEPARLSARSGARSGYPLNYSNGPALTTMGAALYRAGRLKAAVQRLTAANHWHGGGGEATSWLFLAMGHARLGHGAEARPWLEKAAAWIEEALTRKPEENPLPWDQRLILQRLRREAEALILPAGPR